MEQSWENSQIRQILTSFEPTWKNCLIKSPAQKANVKVKLIEFLRIFFRNMRSFLARGERVSDKAAKIVTLTKEYLLS